MSIGNGCGPDWFPRWLKVALFNWFFEASCDKHDEGYQEGGSEARRKVCDDKFLEAMLRDTQRRHFLLRPLMKAQAYTFYWIVRKYGRKRFTYRPEY